MEGCFDETDLQHGRRGHLTEPLGFRTQNGLCGEIDLCSEIKVFKNFIKNAFLERVFIYLFFTVNENKTASLLILHFKLKRTVVERLKFSFAFFPLMW